MGGGGIAVDAGDRSSIVLSRGRHRGVLVANGKGEALARVLSIPPGAPVLATLADALLTGRLVPGFPAHAGPDALASATIYLPTRRAARALAAEIAERSGADALVLPRIVPLGEADEAELALAAEEGLAGEGEGALPPPIAPLERRLLLARLIQAWSQAIDRDLARLDAGTPFLVPSSPADAVSLAGDLERLMDDFVLEGVPWERLGAAVDGDFSRYFALTLDFLKIAFEAWPAILAERGASDPTRRASLLVDAEAARLARDPPRGPVIAAGSTGSIPSTARLLSAIARLPAGAVVLPGLDRDLDASAFAAIPGDGVRPPLHNHPQATMARLLAGPLGIRREDVAILGGETLGEGARARERLLSEAMRPAETTDAWARIPAAERLALAAAGTDGIALVEAADEREEALAAAVALRETLAEPGRIAALVTPDRGLARRVCAELGRWGVVAEDSAGTSLADAPAGRLARLAAEAVAEDFAPLAFLALVEHPSLRLGFTASEVARARATLEIGLLRGPEPGAGLAGLRAALDLRRIESGRSRRVPRPRRRIAAEDWALADAFLARMAEAFARFSPDAADPEARIGLCALAAAHRVTLDALLARAEGEGEAAGAEDDDGADSGEEALATLFDDLALVDPETAPTGRFADYPAFFAALARERRADGGTGRAHPRVKILGLLEARLLRVDRVVLGGLDEGIWPPRAKDDAFLNRPLRVELGLAPPERRIGQTAHDFLQALGTRDAVITRAAKREGAPSVPSRFLQRIEAFAGETAHAAMRARGERFLAIARALDAAAPAPPLPRPAPRPDPALFPRRLSVTEIETLIRDPYAIFARHVLGLDALEAIAAEPGAADRGTIAHEIFSRFVEEYPLALPEREHARESLRRIAEDAFAPIARAYPALHAEWEPRFERMVDGFLDWEYERRAELAEILVERAGALDLLVGTQTVTLSARADRIERRRDGGATIVDFKTGTPPSKKMVFAGFSPQLTLEAAMLGEGAFTGAAPPAGETDLLYVHASGGAKPFVPCPIDPPRGDPRSVPELVAEHRARLVGLLARFLGGEYAYLSRPFAQFAQRYSDYDHLARVKEWSASGGLDEGGEP